MAQDKSSRDITYRRDGADLGNLGDGAAREVGHEVLLELLVARRRVRHGVERRQQAKGVGEKKGASGLFRATTHRKGRLGGRRGSAYRQRRPVRSKFKVG